VTVSGGPLNGFMRLGLVAMAALLVPAAEAAGALKPVRVAAGVVHAYKVEADVNPGHPPTLRTLRIDNTGAGVLKWRCAGRCHQNAGPPPSISHPHHNTMIRHLDLRLRGAFTLTLEVVVPSGQSRFLKLTARGRRLRVSAAGCIDAKGRLRPCPAGPHGPTPSPTPTPTAAPSPIPTPAPTTHAETVGGLTHTWTDYANAAGSEGQPISPYQTVQITCKVTGFQVADGNTWWYRIASAPWSDGFYASADAFYNNGQTSGPLHGTPFVDAGVPNC
jgi:hypothetical protein